MRDRGYTTERYQHGNGAIETSRMREEKIGRKLKLAVGKLMSE